MHRGLALVVLHLVSVPGSKRKTLPRTGASCSHGRGRRGDGRACLVLRASAQKGRLSRARRPGLILRRGPAERTPGISGGVGIHVPQSDTPCRKVREDRTVLWGHEKC